MTERNLEDLNAKNVQLTVVGDGQIHGLLLLIVLFVLFLLGSIFINWYIYSQYVQQASDAKYKAERAMVHIEAWRMYTVELTAEMKARGFEVPAPPSIKEIDQTLQQENTP